MKKWIEEYLSEDWKEIETDIDFSKHEPTSISSSLHVHEERYVIDGNSYKLLYLIGCDEPLIEILTLNK